MKLFEVDGIENEGDGEMVKMWGIKEMNGGIIGLERMIEEKEMKEMEEEEVGGGIEWVRIGKRNVDMEDEVEV